MIIYIKEGRCYEKLKDNFNAFESYKKAVKLDKNRTALPFYWLAWIYFRNGDKRLGIENLKKALNIEPDNTEVLVKLGEVLLWSKDTLNEAESYLIWAVNIDENCSDGLITLGRIKEKKGDI